MVKLNNDWDILLENEFKKSDLNPHDQVAFFISSVFFYLQINDPLQKQYRKARLRLHET